MKKESSSTTATGRSLQAETATTIESAKTPIEPHPALW